MSESYLIDLDNKYEAFVVFKKMFRNIKVLSIEKFIEIYGYEPDVASIFVVNQEDSLCKLRHNTLESYGNLQVLELQSAYLSDREPVIPQGEKSGMGYKCPMCRKTSWINASQHVINCASCKMLFMV